MLQNTEIIDKNANDPPGKSGIKSDSIPAPVRMALKVLSDIDPVHAEKLKTPLTALAMTLFKSGKEVTEKLLREKLAQGDNAILGPRAIFNAASGIKKPGPLSIMERYERVAVKMRIVTPLKEIFRDDPDLSNDLRLHRAVKRGDIPMINEMFDRGTAPMTDEHPFWENPAIAAANKGDLDIIKIFLKKNPDNKAMLRELIAGATEWGHLHVLRFFVEQGIDIITGQETALSRSIGASEYALTHFLISKGASIECLGLEQRNEILPVLRNIDHWLLDKGCYPPQGLEKLPPMATDEEIKTVNDVSALLQKEGHNERYSNLYAALALGFFETPDRLIKYFERWAAPGKQPFHDVIYLLAGAPITSTDESLRNSTAWADAMIDCGPEMTRLSVFSGKLHSPVKGADGKKWSLSATRDAVAKIAFEKSGQNPELAKLFSKYDLNEESFNTALDLVKKYKPKKENCIPDIMLDGKKFNMPKAIFKKLPDGDLRGLVLGQITDCCQSIGGIGSACAVHGFSSEDGGFYIVAVNDNKKGTEEIIGQSWAWRGTKGELVLDSLETLGQRISSRQWGALAQEFSKALEKTDIPALHIGKGGDTPQDLKFPAAEHLAKPKDYDGYRDSNEQYLIWRKAP